MKRKCKVFLLFIIVFQIFLVSCNVVVEIQDGVYVSPSGDDSNRGTKYSPVKTLDKALEIARDKLLDTIYIEEGVWLYYSPTTIYIPRGIKIKGGYDSSFSYQKSYSVFSNVAFDVYGVSDVEIRGLYIKNSPSRGIRIEYSRNVVINDCIFSGITNISSFDVEGVSIRILNSSDVRIYNSTIEKAWGSGSKAYGAGIYIYRSYNVEISGNRISECKVMSTTGNAGGGAIAIYASTNITILNNTLRYSGATGSGDNDSVIYFFGSTSKGVSIKYNTIGGVSSFSSYGIYEKVEITEHVVVNNKFSSTTLSYPYYDYYNGSLDINDLNIGKAGTSESSGNSYE